MDRETEMYHAAIKILSNRAGQYDDELFHTYRNISIFNKYGYYVPQEEVDRIIDSKISNIPSDISKMLSELGDPSMVSKNSRGYASYEMSKSQYGAEKRLWKAYIDKITKDVGDELKAKGWTYTSDDALQKMVVNRFANKYPKYQSKMEWLFEDYYYKPSPESIQEMGARKLQDKAWNDYNASWRKDKLLKRVRSDKAGTKRKQDEIDRNNRVTMNSRKNQMLRNARSEKHT